MTDEASAPSSTRNVPSAPVGQPTLPFEDSTLDAPIAYGLTARARRVVAPATLPDLTLVPGSDTDAPDPFDTRPARARALRRSGRDLRQIASELEVDEGLAATWTLGVSGPSLRLDRRRPHSRPPEVRGDVSMPLERRAAVVCDDVAAASLVVGLARVTAHAVTLTTADPKVAGSVVAWLRARMGIAGARMRLTLATGHAVARDVVAHRWAETVGIPRQQVLASVWPDAPEPDAVRATLRVADPRLATLVASWRAAFQAGEPPPCRTPAVAASQPPMSFQTPCDAPSSAGRGSFSPTS
ncbi:MAG: hypothetical protein ABR592_07530 [Nitriliruptorales bacterium]